MNQYPQQFNPQVPPPQQQMPSQQSFGQPHLPHENPGQSLSVVGLVLGILGILMLCATLFSFGLSLILGIPLSIAGLVCGIMGRNRTPYGMENGMAVASIIVGVIGIALGVMAMLIFVLFGAIIFAETMASPEMMELRELMDSLEAY